jgi:hypothetical protein
MTKSSNPSRNTFSPQVQKQISDILLRVGKFKQEVDSILTKLKPTTVPKETIRILEHLLLGFHSVSKQLQERQRNRKPLVLKDEYDVQYLLHALLTLYFKDIRREEYCPSYAGTSARIDFFLDDEKIAIEAKMASEKHRKKKIAEELIIDKEYYRKKEGCKILYCLVYDPKEIISNRHGFEKDLYEKRDDFEVKVFVVPRKS